jgi:hypothetical protein
MMKSRRYRRTLFSAPIRIISISKCSDTTIPPPAAPRLSAPFAKGGVAEFPPWKKGGEGGFINSFLEGVLAVVVPCHCERREAIVALVFPALQDCFVAFGSSQ